MRCTSCIKCAVLRVMVTARHHQPCAKKPTHDRSANAQCGKSRFLVLIVTKFCYSSQPDIRGKFFRLFVSRNLSPRHDPKFAFWERPSMQETRHFVALVICATAHRWGNTGRACALQTGLCETTRKECLTMITLLYFAVKTRYAPPMPDPHPPSQGIGRFSLRAGEADGRANVPGAARPTAGRRLAREYPRCDAGNWFSRRGWQVKTFGRGSRTCHASWGMRSGLVVRHASVGERSTQCHFCVERSAVAVSDDRSYECSPYPGCALGRPNASHGGSCAVFCRVSFQVDEGLANTREFLAGLFALNPAFCFHVANADDGAMMLLPNDLMAFCARAYRRRGATRVETVNTQHIGLLCYRAMVLQSRGTLATLVSRS